MRDRRMALGVVRVLEIRGALQVDVLVQRAAAGDVQHLAAAADAHQGLVFFDAQARQLEFEHVALVVDVAAVILDLLAVKIWMDIRSAAQQHAVHGLEQFGFLV